MISITAQSVISDLQAKKPIDLHDWSVDEWIDIAREIRSLNTIESRRWIAKIQVAIVNAGLIDDDTFVDRLQRTPA